MRFHCGRGYPAWHHINRNKITDLRPIHTKDDNYNDKDITIHTSEQHRLFVLPL